MVAVGVISFIIGGFVGTSIMALCVAARNEEDRRERDADLNDFINKTSEER